MVYSSATSLGTFLHVHDAVVELIEPAEVQGPEVSGPEAVAHLLEAHASRESRTSVGVQLALVGSATSRQKFSRADPASEFAVYVASPVPSANQVVFL